jgi:hypothetical protein
MLSTLLSLNKKRCFGNIQNTHKMLDASIYPLISFRIMQASRGVLPHAQRKGLYALGD